MDQFYHVDRVDREIFRVPGVEEGGGAKICAGSVYGTRHSTKTSCTASLDIILYGDKEIIVLKILQEDYCYCH